MFGIALFANAGGIAKVIGSPSNSVLIGMLENQYQIEITFLKWMSFGLPFSIIMVGAIYGCWVKYMFPSIDAKFTALFELISKEIRTLGTISKKEKRVCLFLQLLDILNQK